MTIDLAAAQARAEQAMALYEASQHKHYTAVGCVPDLARLVLDLVARVREVERAIEPFTVYAVELAALRMLDDPPQGNPGGYFEPAKWRALIEVMTEPATSPRRRQKAPDHE